MRKEGALLKRRVKREKRRKERRENLSGRPTDKQYKRRPPKKKKKRRSAESEKLLNTVPTKILQEKKPCVMTDRRRVNGPPSGTRPAIFASALKTATTATDRPTRQRQPTDLRRICTCERMEGKKEERAHNADNFLVLRTGIIPSTSGSAYLEAEPSALLAAARSKPKSLIAPSSALKVACAVHGPKPLPRSAPFSPNLVITAHVKYAPFASRQRKGHIRDSSERDLGVHLEMALRGVIIAERWPKSALDLTVPVLEAEDDRWWGDVPDSHDASWGMMNVLAGCITTASAAIADARIDCLDLATGGVAALVLDNKAQDQNDGKKDVDMSLPELMLDIDPAEHQTVISMCAVAYLSNRDEITELWLKGDSSRLSLGVDDKRMGHEALVDGAVDAARGAHTVLAEAVRESAERFSGRE